MKIKTRDGSLRELNAEDVYKQVSDYLEKLELEDGYDEGLTEEEAEQYEHIARQRLGEVLRPLVPVVVAKGGFTAVTSDVLAFPYSTANSPVVTYDLWRCVGSDDGYYYELGKDMRAKLNRECMGGINNAITLFKRANGHFDRIIKAMASGKLTTATGDRFPVDGMGYPDLTRYARGCHGTVQPRGEGIEPWHATYPPEMSKALGITQTVEVGGVECGFRPYGSMTSWDKFKVIANLCESDYEGEIYHMLRGRYDKMSDTVLARNRAIEIDVISNIDGHLAAFTTDDMWDAFSRNRIKRLPDQEDLNAQFDSSGLLLGDVSKIELDQSQQAFLMAVLSMIMRQSEFDDETSTISFSVPGILNDLRIDPRGKSTKREAGQSMEDLRVNKMLELIQPWERCVGLMPDGSFYKVLSFEGYDASTQTMDISTPYVFKCIRHAYERNTDHSKVLHEYLHSNVINENPYAVEVANRLAKGLARRGKGRKKAITSKTITDEKGRKTELQYDEKQPKKAPYDAKWSFIISECPDLKARLAAIEAEHANNWAQMYNTTLKQAFEGGFRIIMEKSDFPSIFKDFKVPTRRMRMTVGRGANKRVEERECYVYPTRSKVRSGEKFVITYSGMNGQPN